MEKNTSSGYRTPYGHSDVDSNKYLLTKQTMRVIERNGGVSNPGYVVYSIYAITTL